MSPRSRVEDVSTPTPGELGFVMPIETARHDACWMAWPHDGHADAWGDDLADVHCLVSNQCSKELICAAPSAVKPREMRGAIVGFQQRGVDSPVVPRK